MNREPHDWVHAYREAMDPPTEVRARVYEALSEELSEPPRTRPRRVRSIALVSVGVAMAATVLLWGRCSQPAMGRLAERDPHEAAMDSARGEDGAQAHSGSPRSGRRSVATRRLPAPALPTEEPVVEAQSQAVPRHEQPAVKVVSAAAPPTAESAAAPRRTVTRPVQQSSAKQPTPSVSPKTIAKLVADLRRVELLLGVGDASSAHAILRGRKSAYVDAGLAEEFEAYRVLIACRRTSEGERQATLFGQRYPNSMYTKRVTRACSDAP